MLQLHELIEIEINMTLITHSAFFEIISNRFWFNDLQKIDVETRQTDNQNAGI